MHFGARLTEEYNWLTSRFCAPFPQKSCLWWQLSAENGSELPSTYNKMGVMDAWSRKTLKRLKKFLRFLAKRPLTVKFVKFCSESFHRDNDRRVVYKFRKIWLTENRWHSELLTCQETKFRLALHLLILHWSRPKSARASPRECRSAPDFIQIGSFSAKL